MPESPLSTIRKIDHQLYEHIHNTDRLIFDDGAIPSKYKILFAMAFDAAHGATEGVRSLAQRATREGATREEIVEAIRVAYYLSGVGAVYTASQGLKEFTTE